VRLGVRNVFDNSADRPRRVNGYGIMQWPSASPFGFNGRFVYARLETALGR
jgi:iron complex outermembrane receptor protein